MRALPTLVLPAAVFAAVACRVLRGESISWDARTYDFLATLVPRLDVPVAAHTLLVTGALAGAVATTGAVVLLIRRRQPRELAFLMLSVGGMIVLDPVLKAIFRRPPVSPDGSDYSFPSGTAMVSLALLGAVTVLVAERRLRWALIVAGGLGVVALGVSVVYLRWHYTSDVVGGWCLAMGWLSVLWLALLDHPRQSSENRRS